MPVREYKTIPEKYQKYKILSWVAFFIPLPTDKYTPDFVIKDYGFASTVAINKIPLGIIIIIISILVKIL